MAGTVPDSTPRKKCRFCKGLFTPNPNQARHDFCQTSCRKDFHKYGAFPVAKFKADIQKHVAKLIAAELAPLVKRIAALELAADASARLQTPLAPAGYRGRNGGAAA